MVEQYFYVDGEFVTGSRSHVKDKMDTSPKVPEEVIKFADTALERTGFYPDPVFVVDVVGRDDNFWEDFSIMDGHVLVYTNVRLLNL